MELINLEFRNGMWQADLYCDGYFTTENFLFYTKKEVIYKLRHEFGVKVGREFC